MGLFSNKPWVNIYSGEANGTRSTKSDVKLLVKLDVRLKKKNEYEYKTYAVELADGSHFQDITLDWLLKYDKERITELIKEFNLK